MKYGFCGFKSLVISDLAFDVVFLNGNNDKFSLNVISYIFHIDFFIFFSLQVFTANNVELVTKTRTEHLTGKDKLKAKKSSSKTPLESFLGTAEETITNTSNSTSLEGVSIRNSFHVDINVGSNLN